MAQILDVFIAFLLTVVRIVFKYIFNSSLKKLKWGFHIFTFMDMNPNPNFPI